MQVNPVMLQAFKLYSAPKRKNQNVPYTTLAHRVLYAEAKHKGVDLYYLNNGDTLQSLVVSGETSLAEFARTHGAGFIRINRNLIVNTAAITGVFPTSDKEYGLSMIGTSTILPISRRSVKAVKAAYASINV